MSEQNQPVDANETRSVSPTEHIQSHIGLKGKDYVEAVDWKAEFVYPSDEEYAQQTITTPIEKVLVKGSRKVPKLVGKKGEKRQALDEDGNEIFINQGYAKPVGAYVFKDVLLSWLEEHGLDIMMGKMLAPIVAAGQNKNINNPVPDNYTFSIGQVQAFYDGQTLEDILKSLMFQGWAPPTTKLSTAAAIAIACPVEFDEYVESKFFSYVASKFEGAKADTYKIGTAAGWKSITTFIGKQCRTPRLPKSTYLSEAVTVLNQLSATAEQQRQQLKAAVEAGKFEEGSEQYKQASGLLEVLNERLHVYNHVLCALNEAHKQALRKEAAAAAKKAKTESVSKAEPDMVDALLSGGDISELLMGEVDLIPDMEEELAEANEEV